MKKLFASALLALSLFASPVIPQEHTPFTVYIASHTHKGDVIAETFVAALTEQLKHDVSAGGIIVSKDAEDADVSGLEIVLMSVPNVDGKGSAIFMDVCEHTKGQTFDLLIGATVGRTSAEDAASNGVSSASYVEQASEAYDEVTAPNTLPKS